MKIFIILISIILAAVGYLHDFAQYPLYCVYICVNMAILMSLAKKKDVRKNISYIFLFLCWLIFNCLGFIHAAILDGHFHRPTNITIYFLFILSTIILYIPIKYAIIKRGTYKPLKVIDNFIITRKVAFMLMAVGVLFQLYKLATAGGFNAYSEAAYGEKLDSSVSTFFHLFGGFVGKFSVFLMPFLLRKDTKILRYTVIAYLLFNILIGVVGGSSSSLLWPIISLFLFLYFAVNSNNARRKIKLFFIGGILIGIIGGMLIRVNRKDNANFQTVELKEAYKEIMLSPTFDNATNLRYIIDNIEPLYEPNQTIYPFVFYLPRSIFPWKPMPLGRIVGVKYVGASEDSRIAFITGPIGDFYFDFGVLGVIFGMFFCGYIISYITERYNCSKQNIYTWGLFVGFMSPFVNFTSWYTGWGTSVVELFMLTMILLYVHKKYRI